MLSMTNLRERSQIILWTLLFFFVASMTVGGLVGGANIIGVIKSAFGGVDTTLHVGRVGDENISISYYLNERQNQINRLRQQGRNIDSRAIQNAGDFAWNAIVERSIKDKKINEFNLSVQEDEIYNFLLFSPPDAFQNNLIDLGLFKDEESNFNLEEYQNSVRQGLLPDTTRQVLFAWEQYLKTYLADRKLQNLFSKSISVSPLEVKNDYINNNLNCTIDLLSININDIDDNLIEIEDSKILEKYENEKGDKYSIDETVTLDYVLFNNIDPTGLDSTTIVDLQDSLLQRAIDFASDASIMTFKEALDEYDLSITNTINVTESFKNNSGIPFSMGFLRQAVRFGFDNKIGMSSEAFTCDNGIAIFNIVKKNSSTYKNLDEVENSIKRELIKEDKVKYAYNLFQSLDLSLNNWNEISEDSLINFNENETSTFYGNFKNIGRNAKLSGLIKEMKKGDISEIIESSSQVFVFKLKDKDILNVDEYNEIYDSLNNRLLLRERSSAYSSWLSNEKKNITIKDMRHKIF